MLGITGDTEGSYLARISGVCSVWDGIDCGYSTDDDSITKRPGPRPRVGERIKSSRIESASWNQRQERETETESDCWDMI
jgi:hypothetical protein